MRPVRNRKKNGMHNLGDEFVDRMNRWRAQEQSKGGYVRRRMNAYYADAMLLAPTTWLGLYFL